MTKETLAGSSGTQNDHSGGEAGLENRLLRKKVVMRGTANNQEYIELDSGF